MTPRLQRKAFAGVIGVAVALAAMAFAAELRTNDGLVCGLDANGRISHLVEGATDLASEASESSGFAVRDCATDALLWARFPVVQTGDTLKQQGGFEQAQLSFSVEARSAGDWIEFAGEIVDERKTEDRAADVIFRLPFQARDVRWWRDIRTSLPTAQKPRTASAKTGQKRTVITFSPVGAHRLRIVQPQGGGCVQNPNTLWIAEVEIFGRDQNLNLLRAGKKVDIKAESTSKNYSTDRLIDGIRNDEWDDDWLKRGWASGDTLTPKWIEFDLPEETEVARVDIYWCLERFGYATSRTLHLERWDGEKWAEIRPVTVESEGAPGDAEKATFQKEDLTFENSIYPFACVTGASGGVALAVSPDSPCVFDMRYLPDDRCVQVLFKFGLSQLPGNPRLKGRAPFKFVLYRVDLEWGFRDAARRYYQMYPEAFRVRTDRFGLWLFTGEALEALAPHNYTFHEGGPRGSDVDEIYNIYTCPYVLVGQREFESSAKDYSEAMEGLRKLDPEKRAYHGAGLKELIENCSLRDPNGKYIMQLRRRGGSYDGPAVVTFPANPDPSLWEDRKRETVAGETLEYVRGLIESDPYLDGIYVDSLASWGAYWNYRREHFAYVDLPLTHDDRGKVIIWNRFPHVEFLRELGKILHPKGKIIFGNGIRNQRMWCAFGCDVCGVECNPSVYGDASHYCWFRTIAYHKPFLLLYYYNYPKEDCPREAAEEYIQSAIAYGIAPEVRPFGKFAKRDMDLYDKFMPIFRQITRAGWEPVTYARASDPRIWLERFGGGDKGLFFTLYNPTTDGIRVSVEIEKDKLRLPPDVLAKELVAGGEWRGKTPEIAIPSKALRTLQVGDAPEPVPVVRMGREELIERVLSLKERRAGAEGNLLANSSFEEVASDGHPIGWGTAASGDAEIKAVDGEAHSGKKSMYLRDSDEKGWADIAIRFSFLQPNTAYELRLWVKQTAKSETSGRLWYQWQKGTERLKALRFDFPKAAEWTECRWELVPPEGADLLRVSLGSSVPEKLEIYLDDVRLFRRKKESDQK